MGPKAVEYNECRTRGATNGVALRVVDISMPAPDPEVGSLEASLDDPAYPHVTYRRGASGQPVPVNRGTGVRVQAVEIAHGTWDLSPEQIASEYSLSESVVRDALAFAAAHRAEIDAAIASEREIERADG